MMKPTVFLHSLGCAKNLVDSELMRGILKKEGYTLVADPAEAEVIVINTCGFIESAKMETIADILELAQYKEQGNCRLLLAVGCMAEKYAAEMAEAMPELDGLMGSGRYEQIGSLISDQLGLDKARTRLDANLYLNRDLEILGPTAYLKIAEGCDNSCSFCLIPQLRGGYHSRPMAEIIEEAAALKQAGVKELVLLAQDTTYYGLDIAGTRLLAPLLEELAKLPFNMIRVLYAYLGGIDDELIEVMRSHDNICHYLDIPVQHSSDRILAAMQRPDTKQSILETIERLRGKIPDIALRTTLIVGFPGESEADFTGLLDFLQEANFDWVGAFPYYQEDDTAAALLPEQVEGPLKQERLRVLMDKAAMITAAKLQKFVGRELEALVIDTAQDDYGEGWFAARSEYQAPEVDGVIYFPSQTAQIGDLVQLKISGSDIYDLLGAEK
jgi:ribosomal protein S12 methylthiotransferase